MSNVDALTKRFNRLKTLREPHERVWSDCFDYSFPIRGSGLQGDNLTAQQALDRKARLLDSTSTDAGLILAANVQGGLTPASTVWLDLEAQTDDAGKRWLQDASHTLHTEIHASNFDSAASECSLDLVGAGWFALYVDTDRDAGGLVFEQWPLSQVYAASSRTDSMCDTVFRSYSLTAEQCFREFGSKCSQRVQEDATKQPDSPVELVHAIYPRFPHIIGAKMARNLPFASCHFEVASKTELRESGYHEMPVVVPRWSVIPNTAYAIGPMFNALPTVRQLNELVRMDMANADLAISGMWIAEDDGVLNPRTIKVGARKVIVANSVDSMKPLSSGGNWQLADERIAQLQASIRKSLMADQLQPQDGPAMTATEIHVRVGMIRQLLGPIYGRLQAEYLKPLVERCFGLAFRAGVFGEPPQSLAGRSYAVQYLSPLARAQKMEDVGAIERLNTNLQAIADLGAAGVSSALAAFDTVDFDAQVRNIGEGLGVPLKDFRTEEAVQQLRDQRAKQQQEQQAQAQQQNTQQMAAEAAMKQRAAA